MIRRALTLLAVLCVLLLPASARAEKPEANASGAALFVADGTRLLYGLNEHDRLPMASTTKIMTALVALERCSLDEIVETPDEAVGVEGSSIYLLRGEQLSLRDMLHGLMLRSGNDAAVAIAVHAAGSVEAFAALMNEKAAALGCENTHFVTPNGLHDEEHYTSASDLGRIACAAMQNADFRSIVSAAYYQTETGDHDRTFQNKNKTLRMYEGGNGVKTGFTKAAGRCLVFAAEREGVQLVGVLLNCPDMWGDAFRLLDAGFDMVERKLLVSAELPLCSLTIQKSETRALAVYPKEDILGTLKRDGSENLTWNVSLLGSLTAPVSAGDTVGTLELCIDGITAGTTPLIVTESAAPRATLGWLKTVIEAFIA